MSHELVESQSTFQSFANESLSTNVTLELFQWTRRRWIHQLRWRRLLPALSKNWRQAEIRSWRMWTLLFRSFQYRRCMHVTNVNLQLFTTFEKWVTLGAFEFTWRHQGRNRRFSFLFQKGLPSPCISSLCWGARPFSRWFDLWYLPLGVQGEAEGGADVDREGKFLALAGQCLAEGQALRGLQNLRWDHVFATKMPYLMFETKMIYCKIFMGILSETLYLLLVF